MYIYTFKLSFAKKRTTLIFDEHIIDIISKAIEDINDGIAFKRDGKKFQIEQFGDSELVLKLNSKNSLKNPSRSISALTRYLTTYHWDIFENSIYNKTLFSLELLSQENRVSSMPQEMSNEDLMKGMIDLLYGYTSISNSETLSRNKTIQEIKKLVAPYIKR
ncbi:MAG: hypothetical protein HFG93_06280 [Dorea sp.]|jgi:hypothetical protein|nr:hypothetical protein [Dorea sp.]